MNSMENMPSTRRADQVPNTVEVNENEVTAEDLNSQLDNIDAITKKINDLDGKDLDSAQVKTFSALIDELESAVNLFKTDLHDYIKAEGPNADREAIANIENQYIQPNAAWIALLRDQVRMSGQVSASEASIGTEAEESKGVMRDMTEDPEAPKEGVATELLDEDTEEVELPEREEEEQIQPPMMMEGEDYGLDDDNNGPSEGALAAK